MASVRQHISMGVVDSFIFESEGKMIWLYVGLLLTGNFIGILLMGLMFASGRSNQCSECRAKMKGVKTMKWILTEDRLPEKDGDYLVTIPLDHTPYIHILGFHNGKFYGDKGDEPNNKRIIAWMELPEPYRKGAE